jgi:hypothetical protein
MGEKYLTEDNLLFVASVATNIEDGFHIATAIELAIDEWYLKTPLKSDYSYRGNAYNEFCTSVLGKRYLVFEESHHSYPMQKALLEFFREYIAPKYKLIIEIVYEALDELTLTNSDEIYPNHSELNFTDFKMEHYLHLENLIRDKITDWNFGFEEILNANLKYDDEFSEININLEDGEEFDKKIS